MTPPPFQAQGTSGRGCDVYRKSSFNIALILFRLIFVFLGFSPCK
uniref:Uncharacterized protein n=1 Tax=Anguilla anguilla TaxID=7936 RepID=A0A0E9VFX1_ANGAN